MRPSLATSTRGIPPPSSFAPLALRFEVPPGLLSWDPNGVCAGHLPAASQQLTSRPHDKQPAQCTDRHQDNRKFSEQMLSDNTNTGTVGCHLNTREFCSWTPSYITTATSTSSVDSDGNALTTSSVRPCLFRGSRPFGKVCLSSTTPGVEYGALNSSSADITEKAAQQARTPSGAREQRSGQQW